MSTSHIHLLAITTNAQRWRELSSAADSGRIVVETTPPDPELVLQELAIRHYPIIILADEVERFNSDFINIITHLAPASTILMVGDSPDLPASTTENGTEINYFIPETDNTKWIEAIHNAAERWRTRTQTDDEAAAVERLTDFYHEVLEGIPYGLALFNSKCRLMLCNSTLSTLLDMPQSALLNISCHELCQTICGGDHLCIVEQTLNDGEMRSAQQQISGKNGNPRDIELCAVRIGEKDEPHVLLVFRDVSIRIALQQRVAVTEEAQLRRMTELQMLGEVSRALHSTKELNEILYLILIAVTSHRGIGFNRAYFLLLDSDSAILTGKLAIGPGSSDEAGQIWSELGRKQPTLQELFADWREHIGADRAVNEKVNRIRISLKEGKSLVAKAVEERKPLILQRCNCNDDSVWGDLDCDECAVIPLISHERVEGVLLVNNAITRHPIEPQQIEQLERFADIAGTAILHARWYLQLEQRLKELKAINNELRENRDKLIRSERLVAIGEIAATVAHEIRNPLSAIGGLANGVREDLPADHPSQPHLAAIVEEIRYLERIVNDTLDFTKPDKMNFVLSSLPEKVHNTLKMMASELDPEQYYIQTYFDPGAEWVWMDPDQIRQVLYNLLKNAIHAMPGGGIIVITTRRHEKEIYLHIRDHGKGVPQEIGEKIFDPFFTTKTSGLGIGLSVSRQIMKRHGGHLSQLAIDGPGAMFRLTFPVAENP